MIRSLDARARVKVLTLEAMLEARRQLKAAGKRLVFTNGCFDLLHVGHLSLLSFARGQGDALVVGLNSDASVRRAKGPQRPIIPQAERALVLSALESVDFVVVFDADEPLALIEALLPDVLVKGEDWAHYVCGREAVERAGGRVVLAPMAAGHSTSAIVARIRASADGSAGAGS